MNRLKRNGAALPEAFSTMYQFLRMQKGLET